MTAQEKIEESHFFLRKLRENSNKIPDVYYYYSAFLNSSLSVLDHLMHDYAQKFNFTIPDDVRSLREEFENEAKKTKNDVAIKFHEWWKIKKDYLTEQNEYGKVFSKKRHYNIHRDSHKPNQTVVLRQTAVPDEGVIHFIPARGRNVEESEIQEAIQSSSEELLKKVNEKLVQRGKPVLEKIEQTVIMYDEGLGSFDLCSAGEMYLLNIENIVREAHQYFE